nr:hypothetical protein [Tanacetum cinerariifolium]
MESYNDLKESEERILSSKRAHTDDVMQGEDKLGENGERVGNSRDFKYRTEIEKDNKHSGDKHREDGERDRQQKDDTDREKRAWDIKRLKVDSDRKINNHGESPIYYDQSARPDARRNLDGEEIGSKSVCSKDAKEYSNNHLEDDRSKLNNHNRRSSSDHNMGRPQNNWNNYPNWSQSPLPNSGFIPFHPVPPPIFNPVMQQFMPPMFGRPPMNMNNLRMPFSGHGNPGVWGNQVRESGPTPLPLHGWEPNNPGFNGSYVFANWDHMRPQLNNQVWESNADMPSAAQKNDHSVQGPTDEVLSGVTQTQIENEKNQPVVNTLEVLKVADQVSGAWKEDAAHISHFYLSKIDVSKDLTEPEIYDQCKSMLNSDLASVSDDSDCKILFLEVNMTYFLNALTVLSIFVANCS